MKYNHHSKLLLYVGITHTVRETVFTELEDTLFLFLDVRNATQDARPTLNGQNLSQGK